MATERERKTVRKRTAPQRLIEDDKEETAQAPTQQVTINKLKEENSFLKSKVNFLEEKCKDVENERDFLRSSLTNALSTKETKEPKRSIVITDSSDEDHVRAEKKKYRKGSKKTKRDDSPSSSFQSSSSSDSSSTPHKTKKYKKGMKTQKSAKSRRVFLPEQVIGRYKKVLKYLSKGATKTEAYQKCGVDRKTIVDTSAIAELEACDITAYNKLRAAFQKGQKLFADRCRQLCTQEPVCSAIEEKKKNGELIDIPQKNK
ncbi:coiled-coil domain-containing protein 106-like [Xyrauchen texanus]|uniref:coiled-coil domain-containing protein 106-like n=1 Tax=Xyrauchen texanus TaxID=154827 RepID=UPI0022428A8C|nr:coiled-coil domain-containing protein 106-like [Xyrauchen texanus]